MYYDYADLIKPLQNCMTDTRLYLWLDSSSTENNVINSARLVDNSNVTIEVFSEYRLSEYGRYVNMHLQFGDINYDQTVNQLDAYTVYQNVSLGNTTSNLVTFLSDVNRDGATNTADAMLLYQQTSGQE